MGTSAIGEDRDGQSKEISLSEIWGYNLPGTKDIAGIPFPNQPQGVGQTFAFLNRDREHNVEQIRRTLASKPPSDQAMAGFVLPGQPDSASLGGIRSRLIGKPGPYKPAFQEGAFTLVFFSHPLSYYARLRKVEREENEITVHYQFEPHTTPESTVHFALIPLGTLPAGEYHVNYEQIRLERKYRDVGFEPVHPEAAEIVCRDFSFTVTGPPENGTRVESNEGITFIPLRQIWAYEMPGTQDATRLGAVKTLEGVWGNEPIDSMSRLFLARFKKREKAGPAFVVDGEGETALKNMVAAFNSKPKEHFSSNKELTLVFYVHLSSNYVRIDAVERVGNEFVVPYQFITHRTYNMTFHFALVPLGKLPPGEYRIGIKQLPPVNQLGTRVDLGKDYSSNVCHNATFYVRE
jgi:hypothetical protein